jgi:hypothetical protein
MAISSTVILLQAVSFYKSSTLSVALEFLPFVRLAILMPKGFRGDDV